MKTALSPPVLKDLSLVILLLLFFFLFRDAPSAYGNSQARGPIRATAAGPMPQPQTPYAMMKNVAF